MTLIDSHAILTYLVDKAAPDGHDLYPRDLKIRAKINETLFLDQGTVFPVLKGVLLSFLFLGPNSSPVALDKLKEVAGILDTLLKDKKYFVGDSRTIADLSMYALFTLADLVDFNWSKYENLNAWYQLIKSELPYDEEINGLPLKTFKERVLSGRAKFA